MLTLTLNRLRVLVYYLTVSSFLLTHDKKHNKRNEQYNANSFIVAFGIGFDVIRFDWNRVESNLSWSRHHFYYAL